MLENTTTPADGPEAEVNHAPGIEYPSMDDLAETVRTRKMREGGRRGGKASGKARRRVRGDRYVSAAVAEREAAASAPSPTEEPLDLVLPLKLANGFVAARVGAKWALDAEELETCSTLVNGLVAKYGLPLAGYDLEAAAVICALGYIARRWVPVADVKEAADGKQDNAGGGPEGVGQVVLDEAAALNSAAGASVRPERRAF